MRQIYLVLGLGILVAGCQMRQLPQDYAAAMDTKDKKFNSASCKDLREKAKTYEINYVGPAVASLIVTPVGGIMMSIEDQRRYKFLRELHEACLSTPAPEAWDWPLRKNT